MARITQDVSIDIDTDEYLEACSTIELQHLYAALKGNYEIGDEEDEIRSEGQRNFNRYLQTLQESWLSVSKEDAMIIEILGKKYGAI